MQFALVAPNGSLVALNNDQAVTELPAGATALDAATYAAWAASPHSTYAGGVLTPPPTPVPTLAQQAIAALSAGLAVTSTSTPALNGVYDVGTTAQGRLTAIQTRINAGLPLPEGASTITWIDMAGGPHAFTAAQFTSFAHAVSDYVYVLDMLAMGQGAALPTAAATIP